MCYCKCLIYVMLINCLQMPWETQGRANVKAVLGSCSVPPWQGGVGAVARVLNQLGVQPAMDPGPTALPRKKSAAGCAWQRLLCLRPRRQKKKVAYSTYIHKLLNQVCPDCAWV